MEVSLDMGEAQLAAIVIAVVCGALLCTLIILWTRSGRQAESGTRPADATELHAAMARLQGELPQLIGDMNSKLDAKMRILRELLHEAGRTIEQLRLVQTSPARRSAAASLEQPSAIHNQAVAAETDSPVNEAQAEQLDAAETKTPSPTADPCDLRAQRYSHVYSLADAGLDAAQIAAETGMHRGEVELVLSLRRKRIRVDRASRPEPTRAVKSPEEATV